MAVDKIESQTTKNGVNYPAPYYTPYLKRTRKMKVLSSIIIQQAFQYVIQTSKHYNIDESHALKHSMEVFHVANNIYQHEVLKYPKLQSQRELIYLSAILHDMCDKKYVPEKQGINEIQRFLEQNNMLKKSDIDQLGKIIGTMSYSTVKKNGFPDFGEFNMAYHIVRESDLLTAYDIDRCVIYSMFHEGLDYKGAVERTLKLFDERVLKYRNDKLFVTAYSRNLSLRLHNRAVRELENLRLLFIGTQIKS